MQPSRRSTPAGPSAGYLWAQVGGGPGRPGGGDGPAAATEAANQASQTIQTIDARRRPATAPGRVRHRPDATLSGRPTSSRLPTAVRVSGPRCHSAQRPPILHPEELADDGQEPRPALIGRGDQPE